MTERTVLHVGPGASNITRMPSGFQDGSWREIRFDIEPGARPDIVGTIVDMEAVETGSVDAVFSSHNVEHVFTHEVPKVFSEFRRVLKPDGFAAITCPDIEIVAQHIAQGRLIQPLYVSSAGPITALDILYGHIASVERGEVFMAHRTAFSLKTLQQAAIAGGFGAVLGRRRPRHIDLWAIATVQEKTEAELIEMMNLYGAADPVPQPAAAEPVS